LSPTVYGEEHNCDIEVNSMAWANRPGHAARPGGLADRPPGRSGRHSGGVEGEAEGQQPGVVARRCEAGSRENCADLDAGDEVVAARRSEHRHAVDELLQDPSRRVRLGGDGARRRVRDLLGEPRQNQFTSQTVRIRTMTRLVRLYALLVALILVAGVAHAQTSVGTIEGTVTDEQGAILPGVTATLTGPRGAQTVVTDEKGQYRFISVQPGSYKLKVELGTSFAAQTRDVELGLGKTALVDFTMKVASVSEAVTVTGEAPTVDVRGSSTETSVSNAMLQMTPLYSSTATGLLNA